MRTCSRRRRYLGLPGVLGLTALCATGAGAQARGPLEIEVANVGRDGVLCMRRDGPALPPGTAIWLVQPDTPQSVARAVPGAGACTPWPDAAERPLVPLRVLGGVLDSMRLSIAIVAPAREPAVHDGIATADLDGDGVPERFRACASSEGVHLTIGSGARLRWHRYFYLGYDVEPDCSDADIHDPAPDAALGRRAPPGS